MQARKYGAAEEQAVSSRTTHVVTRPDLTAADAEAKLGGRSTAAAGARQGAEAAWLPSGVSFVTSAFFSDSIKQVGVLLRSLHVWAATFGRR